MRLARSGWVAWVVGGLVGLVVCVEVRSWLSRAGPAIETPRYLCAARDLPPSHPVVVTDFTYRHADDGEAIPAGTYTDQDWHLLTGRRLSEGLSRGELLTERRLAPRRLSARVPKGRRAYALEMENELDLKPGDRVDVVSSRTLIEGLLVLGSGENRVVLAATGAEIELLEKARQSGKLTLVLRHPDDVSRPQRKPRRRSGGIEIWSEEGE